ncbi:LuxR C-terminal-related transcriptional regulator [Actinoplanes sp. NPDC024001]|uniref:helix-turn-helix transcriptional regulator n=1 Tax=Actinoplanes sp. NPDC024001 TaxID=3154598 RepID=UPI00340749C9
MANILWGRAAELTAIREMIGKAPERGGTLVFRGGAGIGKSALLKAAEADAAGMRVIHLEGVQAEFRIPFAALHTLATALGDPGLAGPHGDVFQISVPLLAKLAETAAARPLLLLIDDAQWLDGPSWEALAFIARRVTADPVLILMTMRDGEEADARLAGRGLTELRLEPLTEADSSAMLSAHAPDLSVRLRERVLAEAAGNPLGLLELATVARAGDDGLPPAALPLTTRLERAFSAAVVELPAPTRAVLLVAALDEHDALAEILGAATTLAGAPVTVADVDPAIAAGLLATTAGSGYRLRFRHPLVRSAVRQSATLAQRQRGHAALAEVAVDPDRVLWHRALASTSIDEQLADELAGLAGRMRPSLTAAQLWEHAGRLTAAPAQRATRLANAAITAMDNGDSRTAVRLLADIEPQDLPTAARIRLGLAREWIADTGWTGAMRLPGYIDLAEQLRQAGNHEHALSLFGQISPRFYWSNPDPGLRATAVEVLERLDVDDAHQALHTAALGMIAPIERGAVAVERMRALVGRADLDAHHLYMLGTSASGVGALKEATTFAASAVAVLREERLVTWLAQSLINQAWTAAQLGDTVLALTAAAEAQVLATDTQQRQYVMSAILVRAQAEALRGNGEMARTLAEQGEQALLSIGAHTMLAQARTAQGIDALADGRYSEAVDILDTVFDTADVAFHPYIRVFLIAHLAEAAMHSGRPEVARRRIEDLAPVAAVMRSPYLDVALICAGALLAADEEAEEALAGALAHDLTAWPFERARLQLTYGTWLRRRRPAQARPLLRNAAGTLEALGTRPWADRANSELRASGETRRRQDENIDQLTPQELQVARLVAEGLTNREIAARLFLSPRTVGTHLYRIYPKVGISTRAELAGFMARLDQE